MHELKIYSGVMCNDTEEWWKIWRRTDLSFQNCHKNLRILTQALYSLKNLHFNGLLLTKVYMFQYRGAILHDTGEWCKIWRNTDLWFGKWHEEFVKFLAEYLKVSKIGTLLGSFFPKKKIYELKIYRGVFCHDNEKWGKIWRGIDWPVQNWHWDFDEFWPGH